MAKLNIVKYGDEILRKPCREVEAITPRILTLLDDMRETMHAADGCGLAAPQVGILRRIAIVELEDDGIFLELINPKILAFSGEQTDDEGCLSLPNERVTVKRPMYVTVRATNRKGETFDISGEGLLARALCHEIDHLDGKLMIDRALPTPRSKKKK